MAETRLMLAGLGALFALVVLLMLITGAWSAYHHSMGTGVKFAPSPSAGCGLDIWGTDPGFYCE